jgi:two-component system NtrC family sensor kinase
MRLSRRLLADRRIEPVLDLADGLPRVLGDQVEFEQVLINLLNNAVEAMGDGDLLRLVSRMRENCVIVAVADSGKGIRAQDLDSIFDPFFTTKKLGEGTGLGLSISYGIVQKMGGHIEVDSRPGEGATFRVVLPAREV